MGWQELLANLRPLEEEHQHRDDKDDHHDRPNQSQTDCCKHPLLLSSISEAQIPNSSIAKLRPSRSVGFSRNGYPFFEGAARRDQGRNAMTETDEQRGDPEIGVCHVCGQTFETQLALSQHLMEVHPDDVLPTDS